MSHGGGGSDLSKLKIVSKVDLAYRQSVSALSCLSSDCRRYRHPRSDGVFAHVDTLSVNNQSDVSCCLVGIKNERGIATENVKRT
jgi:hypothetical protein